MGNLYRIMEKITLTCCLYKRAETCRIEVDDNLGCLVEKIKQVFSCSEAKDIELWKIEIPDDHKDEFLDLVLNDNDKLTEGEVGNLTVIGQSSLPKIMFMSS